MIQVSDFSFYVFLYNSQIFYRQILWQPAAQLLITSNQMRLLSSINILLTKAWETNLHT